MTARHLSIFLGLTTIMASALQGADSFIRDGDFSGQKGEVSDPWEVRYGLKASDPSSRPRWAVIPRTAEDGSVYLACEETGAAAGSVLVGQRLRLPADLSGDMELGVTYQTFCELPSRSGSVLVGVCSTEAWDALARQPAEAQPVATEGWDFVSEVHKNRDDVTAWRTSRTRGRELREALARHAGSEVVVTVMWSTWHPDSTEWFRLNRVRLGEPEPWLEWAIPPKHAVIGDSYVARLRAYAPSPCRVEAAVRMPGADDGWRWTRCGSDAGDSYAFTAEFEVGEGVPQAVRARLLCEGAVVAELEPAVLTPITRPEHPCVYFTPEIIAGMKERIREHEWAAAQFAKHRENADQWVEPREMPEIAPGGWSHDYVCPEDGARLRWREEYPTQHLCRSCGKEWSDPKHNAFWRCVLHGRFAGALRDLGLAWQITGEDRYAEAGRRILLWYGRNYSKYPEGRGPAGRGRVNSQSLSECTWLIRMMEGADLLFRALTREERRLVEQGLFIPGVNQISRFRFGIHNIQCWHNACMAATGYFLGDPDWVARGTEGPIGFKAQVEQGILEDGMWYERSLGYHNYTLSALMSHCEAARNNGDNLYTMGRIRRMFTVPLRMAQPNLVPPSLNDQGYRRGTIGTFPLEMAWSWYDDDTAAGALRYLYDSGTTRGGLHALKYGKPIPEDAAMGALESVNMPGAGLAILRVGGRDGTCAMLEYGEHGGGHGHPDKLQLILYGLGRTLCPDLGTTGYGVPLHRRWYKTTPSHNTVTVGFNNQRRASGTLLGFETGEGWGAAAAETTEAYRGWTMTRSLFLTEDFLMDVFDVAGESDEVIDWFVRAPGVLSSELDTEAIEEKPPNLTYAYITDAAAATVSDPWQAVWTMPGDDAGRLVLTMGGKPETQVTTCLAPGVAGQDPWHTLRVRRRGTSTRFVAVYQMVREGEEVERVVVEGGKARIGTVEIALPTTERPTMQPQR